MCRSRTSRHLVVFMIIFIHSNLCTMLAHKVLLICCLHLDWILQLATFYLKGFIVLATHCECNMLWQFRSLFGNLILNHQTQTINWQQVWTLFRRECNPKLHSLIIMLHSSHAFRIDTWDWKIDNSFGIGLLVPKITFISLYPTNKTWIFHGSLGLHQASRPCTLQFKVHMLPSFGKSHDWTLQPITIFKVLPNHSNP